MKKRDRRDYLKDIVDSIEEIALFIGAMDYKERYSFVKSYDGSDV